jgi:hypothetical protein
MSKEDIFWINGNPSRPMKRPLEAMILTLTNNESLLPQIKTGCFAEFSLSEIPRSFVPTRSGLRMTNDGLGMLC